jgi:serine/threonine protein kinase
MVETHTPEWLERLRSRKVWFCDVESSEHEEFSSLVELQEHVSLAHPGLPPGQLASMEEYNTSLVPFEDPRLCPLCYDSIESTGAAADNSLGDAKHIGRHLKWLAFLSMNDPDGHDATTGQSSEASNRSVDGSAVTANLPRVGSPLDPLEPHESQGSGIPSLTMVPIPDAVDSSLQSESRPRHISTPGSIRLPPGKRRPVQLRRLIHESLVQSALDARYFLPHGFFDREITEDVIKDELGDIPADVVRFVHENAKIFFAILVFIRAPDPAEAIQTLFRYGLTDASLPIPREAIDDNCDEDPATRRCNHGPERDAFHHEPWDYDTLWDVHRTQWQFLAPVLTEGQLREPLVVDIILPIVAVGVSPKSGSFGTLTEVQIHPDHQRMVKKVSKRRGTVSDRPTTDQIKVGDREPVMALKELFQQSESDAGWKPETELLARRLEHKHILTAVAAFERGNRRYLLFPWAGGGDLREYWTNNDLRPTTRIAVHDFLRQMLGLSQAIAALHERHWRHGDVKPENILCFKDGTSLGSLKLGDLGLARRHPTETQERREATTTRYGSLRYEAPEAALEASSPRSRRYDIWSLGCVMMEFVVWLLYGPAGLRDLDEGLRDVHGFPGALYSIRSGEKGDGRVIVHPEAVKWLSTIRAKLEFSRPTALGDLIKLVRDQMLVPDVQERADAVLVVSALRRIYDRSVDDSDYLFPRDTNRSQQRWNPQATPTSSGTADLPLYRGLKKQAFGNPWRPELKNPEVCS